MRTAHDAGGQFVPASGPAASGFLVDPVTALPGVEVRHVDCGVFEAGFARVGCRDCHEEYLVACSCKGRELRSPCAAKRAAATAELLRGEVLGEVGHAQWVFTIPKMLRPCFLHHREPLDKLARAAWDTVRELMVAATGDPDRGPQPRATLET